MTHTFDIRSVLVLVILLATLVHSAACAPNRGYPPFGEHADQFEREPVSQAVTPMPRPSPPDDFVLRPIDAVVRDEKLFIAIEVAGDSRAETGLGGVYYRAATVARDAYLYLFDGRWELLESGDRIPLQWTRAPLGVRWNRVGEHELYPQFYDYKTLDQITTFWIWVEPAGAMPDNIQLRSLDGPRPEFVFLKTSVVPHSPVRVRTGNQ